MPEAKPLTQPSETLPHFQEKAPGRLGTVPRGSVGTAGRDATSRGRQLSSMAKCDMGQRLHFWHPLASQHHPTGCSALSIPEAGMAVPWLLPVACWPQSDQC